MFLNIEPQKHEKKNLKSTLKGEILYEILLNKLKYNLQKIKSTGHKCMDHLINFSTYIPCSHYPD